MKCEKCGHKNLYKANYCEKCGNEFSEEYKTKAYNKTIYGIFNKLEDLYSWLTLDKILNHKYMKILLLLIILYGTCTKIMENGNDFIIKNSDTYQVQFNKSEEVYYISSNEYYVNLSLYIPKKTENILVHEYDIQHQLLNSTTYTIEDSITLLNEQDKYYTIEAVYENSSDHLTVVVYWGE